MAELLGFRLQISLVVPVPANPERDPLDHIDAEFAELIDLLGIVREQAHARYLQVVEDLGVDAVVALIGLVAHLEVRLDRVETAVLELVGGQLLDQADPAAFVRRVVHDDAFAGLDLEAAPDRWVEPAGAKDLAALLEPARKQADEAFGAGLRRGLGQAGVAGPTLTALAASLPAERPPCPTADADCPERVRALALLGRWSALVQLACQQPAGVALPAAFWAEQTVWLSELAPRLASAPPPYEGFARSAAALAPARASLCGAVEGLLAEVASTPR